jgi:acetolactate synthase-1/2/3 large subunit
VLLVEAVAGWHPPSALRNTKVAALGEDPLHSHLPFWGFRADHVLTGHAEASLARLVEQVRRSVKPGSRDAAIKRWGERNEKRRAELQAKARAMGEGRSITAAWAVHQLNQLLPQDAIIVNETISHRGDIARLLDRLPTGGLYEASYGGLGMGLGTALGVKYAHRDRTIVMLIGDGSFYYNPVLAAFGACQEHALPMLVVMFDNAGYFSQKGDVVREFPQGWAVRTNKFAGTSILPRPDYAALARAFGGYGEQVEAPREVRGALERGLQAVSKGQLALINLVLDPVN